MTNLNSQPPLSEQLRRFAHLTIEMGLNLQPGQCVRLTAELAHRNFVQQLVSAAYQAGAPYVHVEWSDDMLLRTRLDYASSDSLDYFPDFEVARYRQMAEEKWARLAIVGPEYPDILDAVDPKRIRLVNQARSRKIKFYAQAQMANQFQWCLVAAATPAWAKKVYVDLPEEEAVAQLWQMILRSSRVDHPDPVAAWEQHDRQLQHLAAFMEKRQVRSIRYVDRTPGPDGKPRTDLKVGLTDRPVWVGGSSPTPDGIRFFANMPTEEIFSTPHRARVDGWLRTSKPTFPFGREVDNAWIKIEDGCVVDFSAEVGYDILEQFFEVPGARRLGEVALVDVRSPINQTGLLFHEILFDENAVCHVAFGEAYPEGMAGSEGLSAAELEAAGVNQSDTHLDVMIGTPAMDVLGTCADGSEVMVMRQGRFVDV